MVALVAEKINVRRYESQCEASEINRCDCIYLFVDILIRPSSTSSQKMNFNTADMRLVKWTGPQLRWRRHKTFTVFQVVHITGKRGLDSSCTFVHTNNPGQSFSSSASSLLKIVHTNPELSFSINRKVRIVRRKQMKHKLRF